MSSPGSNDVMSLDDEQKSKLEAFMKKHPEASRDIALKFNLGRKFVPDRVEECYLNYQKAIQDYKFEGVGISDVLDELRTQKMYIPGSRDKEGAALFVINAGKHVPGKYSVSATLKLAFYLGEVLTSDPKTSQIGITLISNMEGMVWSNFDLQFQRSIINFFQANIPARVKNILLYKCPWWVSMMVKMVSPFIKQKMRERIHLVESGGLASFVDMDELPKDLGGSFLYDHERFIKGEMNKSTNVGFLSTAALPAPQGGYADIDESHTPPLGTQLLVEKVVSEDLQKERENIIKELDQRIQRHEENMKHHSLPSDIAKVLRSRATRMTLDAEGFPALEPQLLHTRDAKASNGKARLNPLAERPGEDYSKEKIRKRVSVSIKKDRLRHLRSLQSDDSDSISAEVSLSSGGHNDGLIQEIPDVPRSKTRFSTFVEVKTFESDDEDVLGENERSITVEDNEQHQESNPTETPMSSFINLNDEVDSDKRAEHLEPPLATTIQRVPRSRGRNPGNKKQRTAVLTGDLGILEFSHSHVPTDAEFPMEVADGKEQAADSQSQPTARGRETSLG